MEILVFLVLAIVLFGSGYAFRGAIHCEVVKLGGELKAEVAALLMNHGPAENEHAHGDHEHPPEHHLEFHIQIDRVHYTVTQRHMTGEQLRHVPPTPIGPDRDLFEVVPGGTDKKIGNDDVVEIRDGKRFFIAPAQINPGSHDIKAKL